MRKSLLILALSLMTSTIFAQSNLKEYKAGHVFYVSLPDYMARTTGLNSSSIIQYKNIVKDVYGFIIEDNKEELKLAEMEFSSINEFYDHFIDDFLIDQEKRTVSEPKYSQKDGVKFVESDLTYFDKEAGGQIYYLVGIVETKSAYYKILSWSTLANKEKFKSDLQKIIYSIRD